MDTRLRRVSDGSQADVNQCALADLRDGIEDFHRGDGVIKLTYASSMLRMGRLTRFPGIEICKEIPYADANAAGLLFFPGTSSESPSFSLPRTSSSASMMLSQAQHIWSAKDGQSFESSRLIEIAEDLGTSRLFAAKDLCGHCRRSAKNLPPARDTPGNLMALQPVRNFLVL